MPDHPVTQVPQRAAQRQSVFIICSSDLRTIRAFADEIEDHLAAQGIPARILLYGVGMKGHEGFLLVEIATDVPPAFMQWLCADEDILDMVVYDVTTNELAHPDLPAWCQREPEKGDGEL